MNKLKEIIDRETNEILPVNFQNTVQEGVFKRIPTPKVSFATQISKRKDNIFLFLTTMFLSTIVYVFGYSESFKLNIYVSNDMISDSTYKFVGIGFIILFLVHDYFERKKRVLI